jgi:hypothetical protein
MVCYSVTNDTDPATVCYNMSDETLCSGVLQCDERYRSFDSVLQHDEWYNSVWSCATEWGATLIWIIMCYSVKCDDLCDSVLLCYQWYRSYDGERGLFSDLVWYNIVSESKCMCYMIHCVEWMISLCWLGTLVLSAFVFVSCLLQVEILSHFPVAPTLEHRASLKSFVSLQFLNSKRVGRTPWRGDQAVSRPLPTQDNTNTE